MGEAIYAESGIIAEIDQMVLFVTDKNKQEVIGICQNMFDKLKKKLNEDPESEWLKKPVIDLASLNNIQAETVDELHSILREIVTVSDETMDTVVEHSEELHDLFSQIIQSYRFAEDACVPDLTEVRAFYSDRWNGDEVPIGEACFIFEVEPCFEERKTQMGKNLEKILGHCDKSTWTVSR